MSKNNKKIVCLGGGNAMPKAVLQELKKYPRIEISVISAMLDSGGSAGRLRKDYKIASPGDIRRAFIALANTSPAIEDLFDFRFKTGELKGHNFANLLITALELSTNNYEKTSKELKRMLNIRHEVLPVTLDNSSLCAELENGKVIKGETNIDVPKYDKKLKLKRVFLKPEAKIYPKSAIAVKNADVIIIGPGDLYSSLAQIFLVKGVSEAIKKSKAKKILICNAMTKIGETNGFSVKDFSEEVEKYLDSKLDFVIYNTAQPSKERLKEYKKEHRELIDMVKFNNDQDKNKFIGSDILSSSGPIIHDSKKLIKVIKNLCKL
jgi:uncharacterized cofD-like protein